jgi:arginyl-tRNA synthetase
MKAYISELLQAAVREISPEEADTVLGSAVFDVSYPRPEFGDYATNAAMMLFKKFSEPPAADPAALAKSLAGTLKKLDHKQTFARISAAGGFVNFAVSPQYLTRRLEQALEQGDRFGSSDLGANQKVIVEYFQNNVAKPPHVGHLRSAVVGDSVNRILKFLGYNTISDTHVGDWGVQFGILLLAYKTMGDRRVIEQDPIQERPSQGRV